MSAPPLGGGGSGSASESAASESAAQTAGKGAGAGAASTPAEAGLDSPAPTGMQLNAQTSPTTPALGALAATATTLSSATSTATASAGPATSASTTAPGSQTVAGFSGPLAPLNMVSAMVSGLASFLGLSPAAGSTPTAPTDPPTLWTLLAWARRQFGQPTDTPAAANTAAPGPTPTSLTTTTSATGAGADQIDAHDPQNPPDQTSGVVTGTVDVTNPGNKTLTFTLTGAAPTNGTVTVNSATGAFTYTPTQAARLAAGQTTPADYDTFTVTVSDGQTSTPVAISVPILPAVISTPTTTTVGYNPMGVAVSTTKTYVANASSNTITVIDRTTGTTTATINVVNTPTAIVLSPDGTKAYVAGNNAISVINTATNTVVNAVVTNGGQAYGLAISPNGQRLYVTNTATNTVSVINTTTSTPTVIATIGVGNTPGGITVSPDGTKVYVANFGNNYVSVINAATNTVTAGIGVGPNPFGIAVSPDGSQLYVANLNSNVVSVINTSTNAVVGSIGVGANPFDLAVSPDGSVLYAANGPDTISMVNTKTGALINTVTIDNAPENAWHQIALSPDGRQIYITDMADASLRTLTLNRGNTAPIAGTATVGTPDTTTGAVAGLLNFTDPDGDALSYNVTQPTTGTVTTTTAGAYTYTPTATARSQAAQGTGPTSATFTVVASDGQASASETVTVPISPSQVANRPPVAGTPSVGVPDRATGTVTGSLNFTDPDGNTLSYSVPTQPSSGTVTVTAAGTFSYTPTAAARAQAAQTPGPDTATFTVVASDGKLTTPETVTVPIAPPNKAPVAGTPTVGTPDSTTGAVAGTLNFTDPDGDPLTYTVPTQPSSGTVTVTAAGGFTFTPTAAARSQAAQTPGTDTATFTVNASDGLATTPVSVTVTILPAPAGNTAPTASPTQSAPNQTTGVISGSVNGSDVDGNTLSYTVTGTGPANGTVSLNATTGAFTYTPTQAARLAAGQTLGADFDTFTVSVSDGQANTPVTVKVAVLPAVVSTPSSASVGFNPLGVAVSSTKTYVANSSNNTVSVVDRTTGQTTTINVVGTPTAVVLSADGTKAYVAGNNAVSVINTATNTVTSTVTTNGGQSYGLALSPNGQRLYVTNIGNNTVSVINTTSTPTLIATIGVGATPAGVTVSPDGTRVYVANFSNNYISVINTANNAVIAGIGVGANPFAVAISPDGTRLYVSNLNSGSVSVINTATSAVIGTIGVGANPFGMSLSPDGSVLYVANGTDTVSVVNTKTSTVINTVTIDTAPENAWHEVAVSPDGRQIYITDMADAALRTLTLNRGNTPPIAGLPTVGTPDPITGAVAGMLNFTDTDGDALSYSVTQPTTGTVVVASDGSFIFTPTQAARDQGAQTPGLATGFNVVASDGQASATESVAVPLSSQPASTESTPYLPFDMPVGDTTHMVFAHYVPWFPISPDNLPASQDYYTTGYLNPYGEGGQHVATGGYMRDRPLPRDPINDPNWQLDDLKTEVGQAKSVGIDGFAVDIVSPTDPRIANLYTASQSTSNFYILPTADMTGPMGSYSSAAFAAAMAPYLTSPGSYKLPDGRVVLGAFQAENESASWWSSTLSTLNTTYGVNVAFVPTFVNANTMESNMVAFAPFSYGFSSWGGRNPRDTSPTNTIQGGPVDVISEAHALGKIWMQPIAFQDDRPYQGVYEESGNTQTNVNDWNLATQDNAEWVEMLTWNDYAEGTAMAPSVQHGYSLLDMQAYSIAQFKYGSAPTITRDAVYVSARDQFANAGTQFYESMPMQLRFGTPPATDTVDVVVFATAPATVVANIGGVVSTCQVGAGKSTCSFPLQIGTISVSLVRNGATAVMVQDPYTVTATPYVQDEEYNVAGGLR